MYGSQENTDFSFLGGMTLTQICVGANETILNLHPTAHVMIASDVKITSRQGGSKLLSTSVEQGPAMFPLLGKVIAHAVGDSNGSLIITWDDGTVTEIMDSSEHYESYTVASADGIIVV